jgi:trk system potassium uptake protein TrkA
VIGIGRFGAAVATTLYDAGHEVLALDMDQRAVQEISGRVTHAVQVDATDAAALDELGVQHFDVGIVGLSSHIERSILITLLLKRLGVPWVISKAQTVLHGEILERVGADKVIFPEQEVGVRLAHSFAAPNVVDYMPVGPDYGIAKMEPPESFVGKRVQDLGLRERYGLTLMLIERKDRVLLHPRLDETVQPGDLLVVVGLDESMEGLRST